ncbi:MAG: hypothetical protein GQ529_07155 [Methyloprofundus sp.]|nr:hypothetical protein [Methyloprofundus sp.]
MQIRKQGKKIQLIRTHYHPEKKRTEGKVFVTFDSSLDVIPENIRLQIDQEETKKLEKYLFDRKEKEKLEDLQFNLLNISNAVNKAREALSVKDLSSDFSVKKANLLYRDIAALLKALHKAGFNNRSGE